MSTFIAYALVLATVALTVYGQFALKWQVMRSPPMPRGAHAITSYVVDLLLTPLVISGLAAAFLASICWMLALTRLPLSHAYPMTSLTLVLVVVGSAWLLGEPVGGVRMAGVALIAVGIVMIGSQT